MSPFQDLLIGLSNVQLWYYLAKFDIRGRYRRTILGPLWTSLNALIFVLIIATVYAQFSNQSIREFLPYVSAGYFIWIYISTTAIESCTVYFTSGSFLKNSPLSPVIFNMRVVVRNLIVFLHSLAVFIPIAYLSDISFKQFFWIIPGIIVLSAMCLCGSIILSVMCSRYRDIEQLVNSIFLAAFFVTPILYDVKILTNEPSLMKYNIFTHMINIIREPMLGQSPNMFSYIVCLCLLGVGIFAAILIYRLGRKRLFLWI